MVLLLLATVTVASTLALIIGAWKEDMPFESLTGKILFTIIGVPTFLFLIGFTVGTVIGWPVAMIAPTHDRHYDTVELHVINMGDGINGRFFLGSGRVDESNVYTYYARMDEGFRSGRIEADDALVIEDSSETPRIEIYRESFSWWISPVGYLDENYVVYVPEGSIKPMIDMDLPE